MRTPPSSVVFDHDTVIDHEMLVPLQGGDMVADSVKELLETRVVHRVIS